MKINKHGTKHMTMQAIADTILARLREADPNNLSDTELATVIRVSDNWVCVEEQVRELVKRAKLSEEYEEADGETFEGIIYKAAEILGVEI